MASPALAQRLDDLGRRLHQLDQHALATRLSYFLWSSLPDDELRTLASRGRLADPRVLRGQVERMVEEARELPLVERERATEVEVCDGLDVDAPAVLATEQSRAIAERTAASATQIASALVAHSDETTMASAGLELAALELTNTTAAMTQTRAAAEHLRERAEALEIFMDSFELR